MPIWYAVHGKRILYIFCDAAVAAVSYAIASALPRIRICAQSYQWITGPFLRRW